MAVLMCANQPVFHLTSHQIINASLMPVLDAKYIESWLKSRSFIQTNRVAEGTVLLADYIDKRINRRRLSLSDCYWVKHDNDYVNNFDNITPYKNDFLSGSNWDYKREVPAAPDRVLGGSVPKEWANLYNQTGFWKYMPENQVYVEMLSLSLADKLGIPVCSAYTDVIKNSEQNSEGLIFKIAATVHSKKFMPDMSIDRAKIYICNMTNPFNMLMTSDTLLGEESLFPDKGHNPHEMVGIYKKIFDEKTAVDFVVRTLVFDLIICNYDRNNNKFNWGYFKDPVTGAVRPAPLYDFNVARTVPPRLITAKKIINGIIENDLYKETAILYLEKWQPIINEFGVPFWEETCDYVLNKLTG